MKPRDLRNEREEHWRELEEHVETIENKGLSELPYEQVRRLGGLYRMAVGSYAVLSELSLDRSLHRYLKQLIARAYLAIYHYDLNPDLDPIRFFRDAVPGTVRKHAGTFVIAVIALLGSMASGLMLTKVDRQYADVLIPSSTAQGRNSSASREELKKVLYSGRETGAQHKMYFSTFLFVHNARVGIMSFGFGLVGGVPALLNGSYNGLMLGGMAGLYHHHELGYEFWGWILPHGVTELLAIILCIQAGVVVGLTIVYPGDRAWIDAVAEAGREAGTIVLGTVPMFLFAGLIEGVLRQTDMSWDARHLFALGTALFWFWYFGFCGRSRSSKTTKHVSNLNQISQL